MGLAPLATTFYHERRGRNPLPRDDRTRGLTTLGELSQENLRGQAIGVMLALATIRRERPEGTMSSLAATDDRTAPVAGPDRLTYGAVHLDVIDANRSLAFWRDLIGLAEVARTADAIHLGVDGRALIVLRPGAGAGRSADGRPLSRRDPPSERGRVRPRAGEDCRRGSAAGADRSHLLEGDIPRRSGRDPARAHPRDARARRRGHGRAGVRHHPGLERPAAGNDRTARCPRRPRPPDRPRRRPPPPDRHDDRPRPSPRRRPRSDAAFLHRRDRVQRRTPSSPASVSATSARAATSHIGSPSTSGRERAHLRRPRARPASGSSSWSSRPAAFVRSASASTPTDTHTSSREAS